jgi:hypothetical protein
LHQRGIQQHRKTTIFKPFKVWVLKDFINQVIIKSAEEDKEYYIEEPFNKEELHFDEKKQNY